MCSLVESVDNINDEWMIGKCARSHLRQDGVAGQGAPHIFHQLKKLEALHYLQHACMEGQMRGGGKA